jgi:hypothetical protein
VWHILSTYEDILTITKFVNFLSSKFVGGMKRIATVLLSVIKYIYKEYHLVVLIVRDLSDTGTHKSHSLQINI